MNKNYQEYVACKPEIRTIFTGEITSGMPYQRDVRNKPVKDIIENFDVHMFMPPVVTENGDGSYKLVDGQHRISALIQMNDTTTQERKCGVEIEKAKSQKNQVEKTST